MKTFTRIVSLLLITLAGYFTQDTHAQSVLDPSDPVVNYNAANPPATPPYGEIGKWVRTKRLSWNTDAYKAYYYKGQGFRLKFPKSYNHTANDGKKYPMVIMFHGRGEAAANTDNEYCLYHGGQTHLNAVNNDKFDGFVFYMQGGQGWSNTHFDLIAEICDYMAANNKLDLFRVSCHGLSAGGQGAWGMMVRHPKLIASGLPMSGTHIGYKDASTVQSLKFTSIWDFQGGLDGNPAPSTSRQVYDAFIAAGGNMKHTVYPNLGHGVWNTAYAEADFFPYMLRAHKANPWALGGRTSFCPGDVINITLGVTAGFSQYEWRKDGDLISGATSNTLQVTGPGIYDCRVREGSIWSDWSPIPANVRYNGVTYSPDPVVDGVMSKVIPAIDTPIVTLSVPEGYASYLWQRAGSSTTLGTSRTLNVSTPGQYRVRVTEQFGCSSEFSNYFNVVDANGPDKPDAPINLTVTTLSKTSLRLDWAQNPSPQFNETNFEVYRASKPGGPFTLLGILPADASTYEDEGDLTSNTTYYYVVRAVNNTAAAAVGAPSAGTTAKDLVPPTAPTNLVISGSSRNSISLTWEEPFDDVGVTRYDVYVNGAKAYSTTNTTFTVYGLDSSLTYTFQVKAKDFASNESPFSNQVTGQPIFRGLSYKHYHGSWSVLPDFAALTPVATGVVATPVLDPRTRNDNIGFLYEGYITVPETGTYIFRTNSDDGSKLYLGALNSQTSPYSHSATPLVNNDGSHGTQNRDGTIYLAAGTYPIAVTYFNGTGGYGLTVSWRLPSSGSYVTIPASAFADPATPGGTAPAAPSNLVATATSHKTIALSWSDNSNNESGFEIYRSNTPTEGFSVIGNAPANATSYIDSAIAPATTYYYKIKSVNGFGESALTYQFLETQWKLDNNLNDVGLDARTLVPTGGPVYDGADKREGTHAIKLNGSSQHLGVNTADGYLRNGYAEKTVAFWMKSTNNTGGRVIFDFGGSDDGLSMTLNNSMLNAGVASNNNRRSISTAYSSSNWNHIALVYKANTLVLYVNGAVSGTINDLAFTSVGVATSGPNSRIGLNDGNHALNSGSARFAGWLDNFTIFGSALSQEGIAAHMNNAFGASQATSLLLPNIPPVPTNLVATGSSTKAVNVTWDFNPTTNSSNTIPAGTQRIEAESYSVMTGVATENSSEGGLNVRAIDANDWMDYNVNIPVGGTVNLAFRVATTTNGAPNFFQVRTSDEQILATVAIPRTTTNQTYTTVNTTVNLNAGMQTLRIYSLRNNWNFNWFEVSTGEATNNTSTTADATGFEIYRSANNNSSFLLLAHVPGNARAYADTGLFANAVYYYKVRALNVGGSSEFTAEDSAITLNNIPVLAAIPASTTIRYGTSFQVNVVATDADPEQLDVVVNNLPAFASYSPTGNGTGVITFNPASAENQGTFEVTVVVNDQHEGVTSQTFTLVVNDNHVPVIGTVNNVSVYENRTATVNITANDGNETDVLSWSFEGLPSFATLDTTTAGTAVLNFAPGFTDHGEYSITATINDGKGGTASKTFNVNVTDVKPGQVIYVNFTRGGSGLESPAPWNNLNKVPALNDLFPSLVDEEGVASNIGLKVTSNWAAIGNGTNTTGTVTGNNSGVYPDAVLKSSFWTDNRAQTIQIYGLDPATKYNFTMLGSRSGTDNRTGLYTLNGVTQSLNASGNTQNTITFSEVTPLSDGTLTLSIVRASGSGGVYLNSLVIEGLFNDTVPVPAKVRSLKAESVNAQVKLSWVDAAYNETGYEVYRSTSVDGPFTLIGAKEAGIQEHTDGTVGGNTLYYYFVKSLNGTYEANSDTVSITTANTSPVLAAIANVNMLTQETVVLNFNATDDPGDVVTLSASNLPAFATLNTTGNGTGTLSIVPGFTTGTFNGVTITATDNMGASVSRTFTITVAPADPNAPSELIATGASRSSIRLIWKDNSSVETGFQVYRSSSAAGPFTLVGTVGANNTSYLDGGLAANGKYHYKVRTMLGGSNYTGYSNVAGTTVAQSQIYINFSDEYPVGLPWNNTNIGPSEGLTIDLHNDLGQPLGLQLVVVDRGWTGVNHTGMNTGNNSGVVPDDVMRNSWYLDVGMVGKQRIDGLDLSKTYSFTFFGSRNGNGQSPNRTTVYRIGDKSVALNCINNVSQTVTIHNVKPDESGSVLIEVTNGEGSPYGYLGACIIQAYTTDSDQGEGTPQSDELFAGTATTVATTTVSDFSVRPATAATTKEEQPAIQKIGVKAYPNPFVEDVTLNVSLVKQTEKLTVVVTDMNGRTVHQKDLRNLPAGTTQVRLGLNNKLQNGTYFIRVIGLDEKPAALKVLKGK